jgi:hypothetical protein
LNGAFSFSFGARGEADESEGRPSTQIVDRWAFVQGEECGKDFEEVESGAGKTLKNAGKTNFAITTLVEFSRVFDVFGSGGKAIVCFRGSYGVF